MRATEIASSIAHNLNRVWNKEAATRVFVWEGGLSVVVGDIVLPCDPEKNPRRYRCVVGGVTGLAEPSWTEGMDSFVDGTATWIRLVGNNNILSSLLLAIGAAFKLLDEDMSLALLQMNILTASGKWLDLWGIWFGVIRYADEADVDYSRRTVASLNGDRTTIAAIQRAVLQLSNEFPVISEPSRAEKLESVDHNLKYYVKIALPGVSGWGFFIDQSYLDVSELEDPMSAALYPLSLFYTAQVDEDMQAAVDSVKAAGIKAVVVREVS